MYISDPSPEAAPTRHRRPLLVALVAVLATPVGAFVLGAQNAGGKVPGVWLWPVVIGAIPVLMGLVATGRSISRRSYGGIWMGASAILLGAAAIYLGWMFLIMGQLQRDGILQ
jgi:hypothetical protein